MRLAAPTLTREKILSASIRLMQQKGFMALSMRDIAHALDIKAPSLYHHFPSKEALAQQALEQYRQEQRAHLQALSERSAVAEQLLGYAQLFSQMLEDDARLCLYLVLSQERAWIPAPCVTELRLFVKQNVEWLEGALHSGGAGKRSSKALSERETADVLFGAFEGFMLMSLNEKGAAKSFLVKANNLLWMLGLLPSRVR
jgi:TetR/AcrR family transcriptional repressor of nem operon